MWSVFKDWIFDIISFFYSFVGDWGMAIIIITVIFRLIMAPIVHKQSKSSYQMQKIQPKIQQLQSKYADDPQRMNVEMQKLYAEAKFNPLAGCLPMLLQMPIFMALFQVLREMGDRVQGTYEFYNLVPSLVTTPSQALGQGFLFFLPYVILMVVFAGATFLPMFLQQKNNSDPKQKQQMYIMSGLMSLMMLWIGWSSPAGVLLFWGVSSLFGVVQQQIAMSIMRKRDEEESNEIEVQPIEIDVTRKEKKPRPKKKGGKKRH
ncbi:YidC/Oxa1 family membrane protein insertase [Adlercreutzia sp. ZJ138]|uniref:YidC/Oxa1 family membrane protein insertase n=1 Tax=Adlercreutzia sp. ZJ138 TaxID=2709405 RepID=UPI0013EAE862|nr:YidC/Oxa1 family membrane protein insertase [Adlercreutzia sp. ZJ138]